MRLLENLKKVFPSVAVTCASNRFRTIAIVVCSVFAVYCATVNYVSQYEIGLARNLLTSTVTKQNAGLHFTHPFIFVVHVDCRPTRVNVHSSSRTACSKLVQFVPEYWDAFVKTEGWRLYWWSNRISFNGSYPEEYRGWRDVARGYAFSSKRYPFFRVIQEIEETH